MKFTLLLLATALCFAQSGKPKVAAPTPTGHVSGHVNRNAPNTIWSDGSVILNPVVSSIGGSIGASGTVTASTEGGSTWLVTNNGVTWVTASSRSQESRRDDGKGPTLQQVDASAQLLAAAKLPSAHYRELALSIGLNPSPITDEVEILQGIAALGMHIYDFDKVDNYLYRKAQRQGANMRWVWKPLRESDVKVTTQSTRWHERMGMIYPSQYAQPIPENVLEHVSALIAKIPKAVILVSDYEVINPDPFLAITTEKLLDGGKIWIVERWDEPGYRETESSPAALSARVSK